MLKEMYFRKKNLCDYCHQKRPVTFIKIPIGFKIRLCRDCLTEALKKQETEVVR